MDNLHIPRRESTKRAALETLEEDKSTKRQCNEYSTPKSSEHSESITARICRSESRLTLHGPQMSIEEIPRGHIRVGSGYEEENTESMEITPSGGTDQVSEGYTPNDNEMDPEILDMDDKFSKFQAQWNESDEEEVTRLDGDMLSVTSDMSTTSSVQFILSQQQFCHNETPASPSKEVDIEALSLAEDQGIASDSYTSSLGTDMIDVLVGREATCFRLHKSRLISKIKWFECEVRGLVILRHDKRAAFCILVEWIYTNSIPKLSNVTDDDDDNEDVFAEQKKALLDACKLGNTIDSTCFMDVVATVYIDSFRPSFAELSTFFCKVPTISPLWNFGVAYIGYAMSTTRPGSPVQWDDYHRMDVEALLLNVPHLMEAYEILKESPYATLDPRALPKCFFHWHEESEYCVEAEKGRSELDEITKQSMGDC